MQNIEIPWIFWTRGIYFKLLIYNYMNDMVRTCRMVWMLLVATIAIVKEPDHLQILHSYRRDWLPTTIHPYSFTAMLAANMCQINYPLVRQCQTALLSYINSSCIMVVDRSHLPSASMFQRPSTAAPRIAVVAAFKEPLFGKDLAGI